jgi:putative acetyltransferase
MPEVEPVLRVYCDFNDRTEDERYWILWYRGRPLDEVAADLGLKHLDPVVLYDDDCMLEVDAVLLFDQVEPEYFVGTHLCARPDWSSRRDTPFAHDWQEGLDIRTDDLSGDQTRALLALHLAGMHANSPPDHVRALDLTGLQAPSVTVFTAWRGQNIAGIGALKDLGDGTAELKSMRTHPDHLRTGVAAHLLRYIVADAAIRGYSRLSLETGSGEAFEPALALYRRRGFVDGEAFSDYERSAFNQFLHLGL